MNIKTIKTINGDELVLDLKGIVDGCVVADTVLIMQMMQDPKTGNVVPAFGDWPALAKPGQTLRIPVTAILSMPVDAHEEVARQYTSNVTGLQLPPAAPKILMG